jgi:hypothetical protein
MNKNDAESKLTERYRKSINEMNKKRLPLFAGLVNANGGTKKKQKLSDEKQELIYSVNHVDSYLSSDNSKMIKYPSSKIVINYWIYIDFPMMQKIMDVMSAGPKCGSKYNHKWWGFSYTDLNEIPYRFWIMEVVYPVEPEIILCQLDNSYMW